MATLWVRLYSQTKLGSPQSPPCTPSWICRHTAASAPGQGAEWQAKCCVPHLWLLQGRTAHRTSGTGSLEAQEQVSTWALDTPCPHFLASVSFFLHKKSSHGDEAGSLSHRNPQNELQAILAKGNLLG